MLCLCILCDAVLFGFVVLFVCVCVLLMFRACLCVLCEVVCVMLYGVCFVCDALCLCVLYYVCGCDYLC